MMSVRILAFYLPQFHPIPENDEWWGKGFTEWTNTGKAKKYFKNHYQPRVPADLGYYDLRVPEIRQAQADMARKYGIEGFCYWHYWFGNGKQLLERPFNEVLESGKPDFPFCLAWANESWKGFNHGLTNRNTLIEQLYPGEQDHIEHFNSLLPAFKDYRYIKINGKLLFLIYQPYQLPNASNFIELWQKLAKENDIPPFYFITQQSHGNNEENALKDLINLGFDAVNFVRTKKFWLDRSLYEKIKFKLCRIFNKPIVKNYEQAMKLFTNKLDEHKNVIPTIIPGWDHTPRSGSEGLILHNSTPELFGKHVREVLEKIKNKNDEQKIIFIKSWNEWAEGNYMEPDLRWGRAYLETLKVELENVIIQEKNV